MIRKNIDLKKFIVRLGFTSVAVVLIMYLAKIWFIDHPCVNHRQTKSEKSPPVQVISWRDAASHYGKYIAVEGTVVATYNSGKVCFLNFDSDYKRHFTVVIFASAFSLFPLNPERFYQGKKVRISGYIKEYRGKPEIILEDPNQIEILK